MTVLPDKAILGGGTFQAAGHIYRDQRNTRVLSVTQVFQMLAMSNYERVPAEVLDRKRQLGVAVHRAVELLVQEVLDWKTVDSELLLYVVAAQRWLRQVHFIVDATEEQGICDTGRMSYGYQIDLRGRMEFEGRYQPAIIDLKTALVASPSWALQTAAYALAAPKVNQKYLRIALHLNAEGDARALVYRDSKDESSFLYMLYSAIWKYNHDYPLEAA